jgi:capsid protein
MVLPDGSLELTRQKAIDLRRNGGTTSGVCDRIASFAVGATGLRPIALTSDESWNTAAEDWWNYVYGPACDFRSRVSMWQFQWQAISLRPVMGGVYWMLMDNGTVRPIEPERIRNPAKIEDQAGCMDGVKVDNETGRILGYWVHGRDKDGQFGAGHSETFVAADKIIPVIRPPWRPDQVREIPDFAPIVPHLQDLAEANRYTLNTMKTQSKPFGFLETAGGGGANSLPRGATRTVGERKRFQLDLLEIMHLNQGEKMNLSVSPTPGSQHIPYMQMQYGLASGGIDYPYEFFTLDFTKCDYARMKAVLLLVNKASRNWQAWLAESLTKLWQWRIGMAMNRRELPQAPVGKDGKSEWRLIDWQAPEEMWIDRQESAQADVLEFQMRQVSMSGAARRRGKDYSDILRQQARDYKLEEQIAKEEGVSSDVLHPKVQIPGQTEKPAEKTEKPAGAPGSQPPEPEETDDE